MTSRAIYWRCFHCGEGFTRAQERWAREHFGRDQLAEPVCLIRTAGESALLSALRAAEDELTGYRAEDGDILRAMWAMQADHRQALIREEEKGYAKGLRDAKAEALLAPELAVQPVYRAEGGHVWKEPVRTPNPAGGESISIGFRVCRMMPEVGDEAAETVAALLNLGEAAQAAKAVQVQDLEQVAQALDQAAAEASPARARTIRNLAEVMRKPGFHGAGT